MIEFCVSTGGIDGLWTVQYCNTPLPFVCADEHVLPASGEGGGGGGEIVFLHLTGDQTIYRGGHVSERDIHSKWQSTITLKR